MISALPEFPTGMGSEVEYREPDAGLFEALLGGELRAEGALESDDVAQAERFAALASAPGSELDTPATSLLAVGLVPDPLSTETRVSTAPITLQQAQLGERASLRADQAPHAARTSVEHAVAISVADSSSIRSGDPSMSPSGAALSQTQAPPQSIVEVATPGISEPSGLQPSTDKVVDRTRVPLPVDQFDQTAQGSQSARVISSQPPPRSPATAVTLAPEAGREGGTAITNVASGDVENRDSGNDPGAAADRSAASVAAAGAGRAEDSSAVQVTELRSETPTAVAEAAPTIAAGVPVPVVSVAPVQDEAQVMGGNAPVRVEDLSAQVRHLADGGGGTARLRLSPPQLGQIELEVTVRGDSVAVRIVAHEQAALSAIEEGRASLIAGLSGRSLRMESLEVSGARLSDRNDNEAALGGRDSSPERDPMKHDRNPGTDSIRKQEVHERSQQFGRSLPRRLGARGGVDLRV